jgi:hypothetical protein
VSNFVIDQVLENITFTLEMIFFSRNTNLHLPGGSTAQPFTKEQLFDRNTN